MKFLTIFCLSSILLSSSVWAHKIKDKHPGKFMPSVFEVVPLNSPVKEAYAKFSLKVPQGFSIDKVKVFVKNANHYKIKDKKFSDVKLVNGELHVEVSKLPPGFYQLFVKVRDKKEKREHDYCGKFHDHTRFVIDESMEVPNPGKAGDKTIQGIDMDMNGIPDHVQRYINATITDPKIKLAVKQFAVAFQQELINADNKQESIAATRRMLDANLCLNEIIEDYITLRDIKNNLKIKFLNTLDRMTANKKVELNFGGQSGSLPDNELAMCQFPIE